MTTHKALDERTLDVLWVIAGNGHATEKVIMTTLRRHKKPVRNRHDLYRCIKRLQYLKLVKYEEEYGEYVLCKTAVYDLHDQEKKHHQHLIKRWDEIKDAHEWNRAMGLRP